MAWRNSFEALLVCFLLVLVCTKAQEQDGIHDQFKDPTGNVNLAPFIRIRSAYQCLQNVTSDSPCPGKHQLTYVGWVNVTAPDTLSYCANCAAQARVVLNCISLVKHDLRFVDGTTVRDINYTISEGCAKEFTGKVLHVNDVGMMHASRVITFTSALVAWLLIRSIHM